MDIKTGREFAFTNPLDDPQLYPRPPPGFHYGYDGTLKAAPYNQVPTTSNNPHEGLYDLYQKECKRRQDAEHKLKELNKEIDEHRHELARIKDEKTSVKPDHCQCCGGPISANGDCYC